MNANKRRNATVALDRLIIKNNSIHFKYEGAHMNNITLHWPLSHKLQIWPHHISLTRGVNGWCLNSLGWKHHKAGGGLQIHREAPRARASLMHLSKKVRVLQVHSQRHVNRRHIFAGVDVHFLSLIFHLKQLFDSK